MTTSMQYIFYPLYGVGILDKSEVHTFDNQTTEFYKVNIIKKKLDIFVPIENAADKGLRPLSTENQWLRARNHLFKNYDCLPADAKKRRLLLRKKLQSGVLLEQVELIRDVIITEKFDFKLSHGDKDILRDACRMLADELAYIKNIPYDLAVKEVNTTIKKRIIADNPKIKF